MNVTTITADATARSENIKAQENIDEACLTQPPSNLSSPTVIGAVAELTSAELTPLDMSSIILGPRSHNVTTVEVSKVSTNVNMEKTLTDTSYPVYVKTLIEAEDVLHRFEGNTKNRYSVWRCPKDFGNSRKQCMLGIYHYTCLICLICCAKTRNGINSQKHASCTSLNISYITSCNRRNHHDNISRTLHCCKLIVRTCYLQACCMLFQQAVTSLQMTSCKILISTLKIQQQSCNDRMKQTFFAVSTTC